MLRTAARWLFVSAMVLCACAGAARAATLTLDAPDGCVDLATLEQEVGELVGRPLAQVPEADFRLTLAQRAGGQWHLKLEALERGAGAAGPAHVRELDAASCNDLGEAAAVAIAVSVRAFAEAAPREKREPAAAQPSTAPAAIVARAAPPPPPTAPSWRPALTLSVAADAGDLPDTGLSVMAGGALRHRGVRLALTLGWVPPRDRFMTGGPGGSFQLAFAAADGCFAPTWTSWTLLGCLGGELGGYWASGLNVARPESRTTFWRAGRASLGGALALNGAVALVVQATSVVPWPRQAFVRDGMTEVFRPAAVALRIGAGLDFLF